MGEIAADAGPELRQTRDDDLLFTQVLLKAIHDLFQRVLKEEVREREAINSPEALRDYLQLAMRHEAAEHFRILFLDRKDRLIRDEVQGRGTVDQAPLYPREVVKRALELGASAVILVHNHPSGDPTPVQGGHRDDPAGGGGAGAGRHRRPRPSDRRRRSGREPARAGNSRLSPIRLAGEPLPPVVRLGSITISRADYFAAEGQLPDPRRHIRARRTS